MLCKFTVGLISIIKTRPEQQQAVLWLQSVRLLWDQADETTVGHDQARSSAV